jgi:hypothetical protein
MSANDKSPFSPNRRELLMGGSAIAMRGMIPGLPMPGIATLSQDNPFLVYSVHIFPMVRDLIEAPHRLNALSDDALFLTLDKGTRCVGAVSPMFFDNSSIYSRYFKPSDEWCANLAEALEEHCKQLGDPIDRTTALATVREYLEYPALYGQPMGNYSSLLEPKVKEAVRALAPRLETLDWQTLINAHADDIEVGVDAVKLPSTILRDYGDCITSELRSTLTGLNQKIHFKQEMEKLKQQTEEEALDAAAKPGEFTHWHVLPSHHQDAMSQGEAYDVFSTENDPRAQRITLEELACRYATVCEILDPRDDDKPHTTIGPIRYQPETKRMEFTVVTEEKDLIDLLRAQAIISYRQLHSKAPEAHV